MLRLKVGHKIHSWDNFRHHFLNQRVPKGMFPNRVPCHGFMAPVLTAPLKNDVEPEHLDSCTRILNFLKFRSFQRGTASLCSLMFSFKVVSYQNLRSKIILPLGQTRTVQSFNLQRLSTSIERKI